MSPGAQLYPRLLADTWVRVALTTFALLALLALLLDPSTPGRAFWIADFAPLCLLALSLALLARPDPALDLSEQRFWRSLSRGFAIWLFAILFHLIAPPHAITHTLVDTLYILFFAILILAIHQQPDRVSIGRGESPPLRGLHAPTAVFVAGLLTYLLLVPQLVGQTHAQDPAAAMVLYLVLDTFVTLLLFHRWLAASVPRWRRIYGLLALSFLSITLTDGLETLIYRYRGLDWGTPLDVFWSIPFLGIILTCRLRDLDPPQSLRPGSEPLFPPYASPVLHILALSLALPVLHFSYHALIETDRLLETTHELTVLFWLLVLGAMAAHRHHLLRQAVERLGEERNRMERNLAERRGDVRLIVEKRQAADQIEASEENFFRAFRHSPEAISITSLPQGSHLELNDRYAELIGYRREQILGKSDTELGLWAAPWQRRRLLHELERHGRVWQMPLTLRNHAGQLRDLLVSAEHLEIDGKLHMLSVAIDITGQRELIEKIRHQTEILESWRAVVFAVDTELAMIYWSRRTAAVTGLDPEAVRHRALALLLPGGRNDQIVLRRRCARGIPWQGRLVLNGADRRQLTLDTTWLPVLDDEGKPFSWLVVAPETP